MKHASTPAAAAASFMEVIRAQQSFDLDRIEAEQRMKGHKAMAEGKQREKEALLVAVKNAMVKRDTAEKTWHSLRRDNLDLDQKNIYKREGMLRVTNIVDVANKENGRNLSRHHEEMTALEAQGRTHKAETHERARHLSCTLQADPDDPRVAKADGVVVKEKEQEQGQGQGFLVLPTISLAEVEATESQVTRLEAQVREQTEGLATLQEQLRKVESDGAGLPRSEEEEELGRLLATARGELARLQAELEEGAEKGDQDGGKEE